MKNKNIILSEQFKQKYYTVRTVQTKILHCQNSSNKYTTLSEQFKQKYYTVRTVQT